MAAGNAADYAAVMSWLDVMLDLWVAEAVTVVVVIQWIGIGFQEWVVVN